MARKSGSSELFKRVRSIARRLETFGKLDAEQRSTKYTRRYLAWEANLLLKQHPDGSPDRLDGTIDSTPFGAQISYLHNEFNFDTARPTENLVLVSHVSFMPIFPPKITEARGSYSAATDAPLLPNYVPRTIMDRLDKNRREAVHELKSEYLPGHESFKGGKDSVTKRINKFLSYDEPVVTTLRSVETLKSDLALHFRQKETQIPCADAAQAHNDKIDEYVGRNGLSSRLSMWREYVLLADDERCQQLSLNWVRHQSHYQTLTMQEQLRLATPGSIFSDPGLNAESTIAAPTLWEVIQFLRSRLDGAAANNSDEPEGLLQFTAFDSLPEGWADYLFGRYLQGANYLVLPLGTLFEPAYLAACKGSESIDSRDSVDLDQLWRDVPGQLRTGRGQGPVTVEAFRRAWLAAQADPIALRQVAKVALRILGPLIAVAFPGARRDENFEFAMCAAADGAALVLSDVRNVSDLEAKSMMSRTLVIDLGMNDYERGRLLKHLTEFSTQRFLALAALGTFRFFSDVLDNLQADLSKATKTWVSQGLPETRMDSEGAAELMGAESEHAEEVLENNKEFIAALENITINLTVLNDLVDGGISAYASSAEMSRERVASRIAAMGEHRLPGFMSLSDVLERRFYKSVRFVASVGRRYSVLRQRISELSALVEAKVQIEQNQQQNTLLEKVDRLTLFGITYYFGTMVAYIVGGWLFLWGKHIPDVLHAMTHVFGKPGEIEDFEAGADLVKVVAYLLFIGVAGYIGKDVLRTFSKEFNPRNSGWFDWFYRPIQQWTLESRAVSKLHSKTQSDTSPKPLKRTG